MHFNENHLQFSPFLTPTGEFISQENTSESNTPLISPAITPSLGFSHLNLLEDERVQEEPLYLSPSMIVLENNKRLKQSLKQQDLVMNPMTPSQLLLDESYAFAITSTATTSTSTSGTTHQNKGMTKSDMDYKNHSSFINLQDSHLPLDFQDCHDYQDLQMETFKKHSHKEAEQKRRDTLKQGFIELKSVIPLKEKHPSRVQLLYLAKEYILELKRQNQHQASIIHNLQGK